jgi:O-antigen/teichoic acid export membrane protein
VKRISKNFFAIIGSDVARKIVGFLTIAYLARIMHAAEFGEINIGFTVLSYAFMVTVGGLSTFGSREVARRGSGELLNTMLSLRLVSAVIVYGCIALGAVLFVRDVIVMKLILLFCLSLFAHPSYFEWFFHGKEEMNMIGIGRTVSGVIYFLLVVLFVHTPEQIILVAVAATIGDCIATLLLMMMYRKRDDTLRFHFTLHGWRTVIKQALPLGAGTLFANFSINLPLIAIGILMTNADAGVYSAASKLVSFLLVLDRVLGTLLLPVSTRLHSYSSERLVSMLNAALKWIIIAALPFAVGGTLVADKLLPFVFGGQYVVAADIFKILIWFFFFTMLHTIYISGLIAAGKEKEFSRIMMMSLAIFAVCVFAGTALFGVTGTAAGMVLSEATTMILTRASFHQAMKTTLPRSLVGILFAAGIMTLAVFFIPVQHVVLSVVVGGVVYGAMLFVTRTISFEEILSIARRV